MFSRSSGLLGFNVIGNGCVQLLDLGTGKLAIEIIGKAVVRNNDGLGVLIVGVSDRGSQHALIAGLKIYGRLTASPSIPIVFRNGNTSGFGFRADKKAMLLIWS